MLACEQDVNSPEHDLPMHTVRRGMGQENRRGARPLR
jgi:hypothetical protein